MIEKRKPLYMTFRLQMYYASVSLFQSVCFMCGISKGYFSVNIKMCFVVASIAFYRLFHTTDFL